jgi:hypothetical protein
MSLPLLGTRIEQACDLAGLWIDGGEIAAFVAITRNAGEGEVIYRRLAAVFLSYNVIDLVRGPCRLFWQVTILAPPLGAII